MLLLRTVAGSRLYGLHNNNSDYDWFEVYSNSGAPRAKQVKQKIVGESDTLTMNLSTFMLYADRSAHQTLDAVFSKKCEVNLLQDWCNSYKLHTATFVPLYKRTLKSFWNMNTLKHKRHALRLAMQMQTGLEYGRFNPTLDPDTARMLLLATEDELEARLYNLVGEDYYGTDHEEAT